MFNFMYTEFLKLKNSKIFLLTILGAISPALLMFLANMAEEFEFTYKKLFEVNTEYMIGLFAVLLCAIIISYLIGREYNEHTLKLIISAPVSKSKYLLGKYLMFLVWVLILMFISGVSAFLFGVVGGAKGFSLNVVFDGFYQLIYGGFLLFLAMSPFMFIAMLINSMVPAMIGGSILVIANMFAWAHTIAPYFPWIAPFLIVSGEISQFSCPSFIPYVVIGIIFIIGILISYIYFIKKDVRL